MFDSIERTDVRVDIEFISNKTMEQDSVITMSSLEIQNLQLTHEQCAAVFYSKTVHLGDMDFIEVDRQMLEILGFNNTFIEKNDKHGDVKVDKQGNPVLSDKRHDFSNAFQSLRNILGFVEGKSFDDLQSHFIIQKAAAPSTAVNRRNGGAGLNKQSVWVRKGMLQKWVQMNEVLKKDSQKNKQVRDSFILSIWTTT